MLSGSGARHAHRRRNDGVLQCLFASTGAPPAWALVRYLTAGLIVGCTIAVVATHLLWPRDREVEETIAVPAA